MRGRILCFPLYKRKKMGYNSLAVNADAPVAQWIEHRIPVPRVGGSSPFRCTKNKREAYASLLFLPHRGTRKGDTSPHTGAKLRAGEQFLARGRVHGWLTAGRRPVGSHPFRSATPGDCHGPYGPRNDIKREDLLALSFYFISNYQLRIRSNSSI